MVFLSFIYLCFYSFILICIHCLNHFSPLVLPPPSPPTPLTSRQNLFCSLLQLCWREDISNNKKDIEFLLVWDKDSYKERFLTLLPSKSVLQPKLIHLYLTSSLLPGHLPIVTSDILRLLYWLLNSGHIKHFQVLGFLLFPIPPVCVLHLACVPCPIILLHLF
jgi:hypothetical protein